MVLSVPNLGITAIKGQPPIIPMTITGEAGWIAQSGPNRRNSGLYTAGGTIEATLIANGQPLGPPSLAVHFLAKTINVKLIAGNRSGLAYNSTYIRG